MADGAKRRIVMNATAYRIERKSAACHVGALALAVLLAVMSGRAHAALYKWTDAHGEVHYSDKLPVEAVNGATTQLNRQGVAVRKTEAARPIAQQPVAHTENEEQQLREAQRAKVLAARRDRALIESYASESEIDLAKSRAVATIDGQVKSAYAYVAQMSKRRQELEVLVGRFARLNQDFDFHFQSVRQTRAPNLRHGCRRRHAAELEDASSRSGYLCSHDGFEPGARPRRAARGGARQLDTLADIQKIDARAQISREPRERGSKFLERHTQGSCPHFGSRRFRRCRLDGSQPSYDLVASSGTDGKRQHD